ncbi:MAG: flippase-like domain-containing protein [Anaerolineales bacterium]|nr:flippase-like domain-containing protein [Anaerolineales bacterium]MCB9004160.1 flippase-like domain-containing protein [Ardenticatenaceae bacterium]
MKKHLSNLLKIGVTVVGLWLVLRSLDPAEIGTAVVQADWHWLVVGFLLISASLFLRAYRWLILLRGIGVQVSFWRLAELYFVGNFFNAFLPSGFGGDVVRVLEVTKDVELDVATGTVFLDRISGLIMLFVMALLMIPFQDTAPAPEITMLVVAGAVVSITVIALLLEHNLIVRFGGWLPGPLSPKGTGLVAKVLKAVQACGWRSVLGALGVSTLFNLMLITWWATTGRALHLDVPYGYYLGVVPILSVALLAPSIGGLGVRELLAPTLFAGAGVGEETAVALSLLIFLLTRLSGLLGAPVYVWSIIRQNRIKAETTPE